MKRFSFFPLQMVAVALSFTLAMSWPHAASAQALVASYDFVCELTSVTLGGDETSGADIQPGDWFIVSAAPPAPDEAPTGTGQFPGGTGSFWDLTRQNICALVPPNQEATIGEAEQSRAIVEDGTPGAATDALGFDSIGAFFTFGATNFDRCGVGLRDEDGQTFNTHEEFPEQVALEDWASSECFLEGTSSGQILTGTAIAELIVEVDASDFAIIQIPYGDVKALQAAIIWANTFRPGSEGKFVLFKFTGTYEEFIFSEPFAGTGNALPVITSRIGTTQPISFTRSITASEPFRLLHVAENGVLDGGTMSIFGTYFISDFFSAEGGGAILVTGNGTLDGSFDISDTFAEGNGGGILATDQATLSLFRTTIRRAESEQNGAAIAVTGMASAEITASGFVGNLTGLFGGAIYRGGTSTVSVDKGINFSNNGAGIAGSAVAVQGDSAPNGALALDLSKSTFFSTRPDRACKIFVDLSNNADPATDVQVSQSNFGSCPSSMIEVTNGELLIQSSFFEDSEGNSVLVGEGVGEIFNSLVLGIGGEQQMQSGDQPSVKASCSGSGNFSSLGFNITYDDSCEFDQSTDLVNTDPIFSEPDENGLRRPLAGSPAIDHGPSGLVDLGNDGTFTLPCGYRDLTGLGTPQDGNGDGIFECDTGAIEAQGSGSIEAGHSAAFFNLARNGEGQYVELINENLAVVYTFTHRPDASGSAWFIGVGNIVENSIVIDELLRPIGTSFGDQFDTGSIDNLDLGGQSMVFNDCEAGDLGGNVAFSGSSEQGYEALVTRAQRLSNILGCGGITPHPNAGLSGSYFLPARDGEGIVVQWLPDGQVLVIFFTYDLNNEQQWVLGIGQSNGFSVTMDALYASSNTSWGSEYDPDEVDLTPWGTFELNWSECGGVQFIYNSTVPGYGSATRNYTRLTSLWGASCPDF